MLTALLLPFASDAFAGGVGLMATGGMHTETLYYYQSVDAEGNEIPDPDLYEQYKDSQLLPNFGFGGEFLLGDRDDRIFGVSRFYFQQDAAQQDPTQDARDPQSVVVARREEARNVGIGTIGLSWGILGNPNKFQFGAATHIGAAFLTTDYTDYLMLQAGPMFTYRPNRQVMVFGEALYTARFRFEVSHAPTVNAGVRYFFD